MARKGLAAAAARKTEDGNNRTTGTAGTIFDIKRFAIHDGPGIRTTIFLAGCPLRCAWCQNPEGLTSAIGLRWSADRCLNCHACITACQVGALSGNRTETVPADAATERIEIDHALCTCCGGCVQACPSDALALSARRLTVEELAQEATADEVFFTVSGGGVTLSGGEPFFQPAFTSELLQELHDRGIHTTVETCLHAPFSAIEAALPTIDFFLVDLKLMDTSMHQQFTGAPNDLIRENFKRLVHRIRGSDQGNSRGSLANRLTVRVPLIPGATATVENVAAIARFIASVDPGIPVELINFNPLARDKYRRLEMTHAFSAVTEKLPPEELRRFIRCVAREGLAVFCDETEDETETGQT